MYLNFYKLNEFPFSLGCEEKFFYESAVHTEALANMIYTIQQRKGMVLITGEVGAGKSFVGNMLGARLGTGCQTVIMQNPPETKKQLLRGFANQIGLTSRATVDKLTLEEGLREHLIRLHARGRLIGLIFDEAQDLPAAALEEVRLLWNWEMDGQRLIQIVLIGQPELREKLQEPKWEPLRQRIVLSYHLQSLPPQDTADYIRHRMKVASNEHTTVEFTPEALSSVHAATDGIPRLINILCDNALLIGYARECETIDKEIIRDALRDMTCWDLRTSQEDSSPSRAYADQ
jgi:general secretion pathway protein A